MADLPFVAMARRLLTSKGPMLLLLGMVAILIYTQHKVAQAKGGHVMQALIKQQLSVMQQTTETPQPAVVETNPIPTRAALESMELVKLIDFFHGYVTSTQALCPRRIRMGKVQDGGWDLCDWPGYRPDPDDCLVYSFGINNDFSYDDAMEQFGCEVHAYDPSMAVEDHLRGRSVHFHKAGISGDNAEVSKDSVKWSLFTLGSLRAMNGHQPGKRRVDVVKMDVEGAELLALSKAIQEGSLEDVTQLCFEMHVLTPREKGNGDPRRSYLLQMLEVLRQLWELGFRLYHTNRNVSLSQIYRSRLDKKLRTVTQELYFLRPRHGHT